MDSLHIESNHNAYCEGAEAKKIVGDSETKSNIQSCQTTTEVATGAIAQRAGMRDANLPREIKIHYIRTHKNKPCLHCGDITGKCGWDDFRTVCFSFSSETKAQFYANTKSEYKLIKFNSEFGYAEFVNLQRQQAKYSELEKYLNDEETEDELNDDAELQRIETPKDNRAFQIYPEYKKLVESLNNIPDQCSLIPVFEKSPYEQKWQSIDKKTISAIKDEIINGTKLFSNKKKKFYRKFPTGYGLKTGDASNGLLAVDFDGESSIGIFKKISNGIHPDKIATVKWTSGKPGRQQILFQVPDEYLEVLKRFTKIAIKELDGTTAVVGADGKQEQLELRYNTMQSVLPPSLHPETGEYKFINSFSDTAIATIPQYLIDYIINHLNKEEEGKQKIEQDRRHRQSNYQPLVLGNNDEIPIFELLPKNLKDLVLYGVAEGGRNDTCRDVILQLLAILEGCDRLGIKTVEKTESDLYPLALNFAQNCSPAMDYSEFESLWSRISNWNITSYYPDDFYHRKAKSYFYNNNREEYYRLYGYKKSANKNNSKDSNQQPFLTTEEWQNQRDIQHKEKWIKSKKLTPTLTTNTKFFTPYIDRIKQYTLFGELSSEDIFIKIPEPNTIIAGCADTGAGKTTWMRLMIEKIREVYPNERWFALGYINGLLLQQCKSWRKTDYGARHFKHLQSEKAFADIRKETQDLALCVHSLKHFENYLEAFDNANIVIDEVASVTTAILQDENIKDIDRQHILNIFSEALNRAKRVFIFDALLSDMHTWYLQNICPNKVFHIIKNENFRPKPEIEFLLGTPNLEAQLSGVDAIKKADNSPICHALLNSKRFILVSDNRSIIQILGELLKDAGKDVLVVCRETNGDADVKAFLACPNEWIQHNWIDKNKDGCVLISPTGGSGIDISIKNYFTDLYGLFFGVIGADAILQMLGRLRDYNAKFHVWVKEKGSIKNILGTFSKEIHRNVREYIKNLQQMIWEGWEGDPALEIISKFSNNLLDKSNDIHFKMQCALLSQQLYEEWHLRDCVIETLNQRGYKINFVIPENEGNASEKIKHKRNILNKQWAEDIFNAPELTDEEASDLRANFFQSPEQKAALKKHSLRSRLPGIDQTKLWNSDFIYQIYFENPFYLSQLECLFLFRNPDLAKKKAQTRWCAALAGESLRHFDIINERYARIKALQNIGIGFFLDPANKWDEDSPELVNAIKEGKKPNNKAALPQASPKSPVKWMQQILKSLGFTTKGSRIDSGKRWYQLKHDDVQEEQKEIILECLNRNDKYQGLGEKQKSLILQSKIAPNPCPESINRDSRSDQFGYSNTGLIWSLTNQECFSISKNTVYGDELEDVFSTEGGHTEKVSSPITAIAPTQEDDFEAIDFSDMDNLTFIKYFAAG